MTQTLHIKGMTCGGCARNVTAALDSIPGISQTTVDLGSNSAIITADREISRNVLFETLDKAVGVATIPWRARRAKAMLRGRKLTETTASAAAEAESKAPGLASTTPTRLSWASRQLCARSWMQR